MCYRCNQCNCSCSCCNQNSLWNILFGNTQRVCRDCCGNLVVTNNSPCWCNNARNSGCYETRCGGCTGYDTANTNTPTNGNGGFACVSYCQNVGNASVFNGGGCNNNASYNGRCGCNAYAAWTQENYGE